MRRDERTELTVCHEPRHAYGAGNFGLEVAGVDADKIYIFHAAIAERLNYRIGRSAIVEAADHQALAGSGVGRGLPRRDDGLDKWFGH